MLNYRNLSNTDYTALRYHLLLEVEENGDPKETAYLDSKAGHRGQFFIIH